MRIIIRQNPSFSFLIPLVFERERERYTTPSGKKQEATSKAHIIPICDGTESSMNVDYNLAPCQLMASIIRNKKHRVSDVRFLLPAL
jgi:hypothetical protein